MKKQKTTSFQPDSEIMPTIREQAEIQDRSVSWIINHYLRKGLEATGIIQPKKPKKKP